MLSDENYESNLCQPSHEVLLNELKYVHETIAQLKKDEEVDKEFRLRTQGILSLLQWVGFSNVIVIVGGLFLYMSK